MGFGILWVWLFLDLFEGFQVTLSCFKAFQAYKVHFWDHLVPRLKSGNLFVWVFSEKTKLSYIIDVEPSILFAIEVVLEVLERFTQHWVE